MVMNRRNFCLAGGAALASLLGSGSLTAAAPRVRPDAAPAAFPAHAAAGPVAIRDIQIAQIEDEYACNLVRITTDAGIIGYGEARPKSSDYLKTVLTLRPLLIGRDPLQIELLTREMIATEAAKPTLLMGAIAGIETALWDLAGKILETPCYNLMGGAIRKRIRAYYDVSPAGTPKTTDPGPWVERAQEAVAAGFTAVKFDIYRGGGDVPEWLTILQAIRHAIGSDIDLAVDLHWRLSLDQSLSLARGARELKLWFIEDPMKYKQTAAYHELITSCDTPILALENLQTLEQFHDLIQQKICTMFSPDAQYCAGLRTFKRVADLGELYGLRITCHNMASPLGTFAQAHACATIHTFDAIENACADRVIRHDGPLYDRGHLVLSDRPGFGVELDEDYCRRHLANGSSFFGK